MRIPWLGWPRGDCLCSLLRRWFLTAQLKR
jgi:hypothetical protein